MRLFDLGEQYDRIGPAAHRFGEHAALLIADIARRRADQPRDAVLFHELGHVDADHRSVVVEQEAGKRLGQFGLADAGGAERSEEHTSELQSLMRISYAVFCLNKKKPNIKLQP